MIPGIGYLEFDTTAEQDMQALDLGVTYKFDYVKGDYARDANGRLIELTGVEAVQAWLEKIIRTEKLRFEAYYDESLSDEDEYGVMLADLVIGSNLPFPFVQAEIQREITRAALRHPRIDSLVEWSFTRKDDKLIVSFTCILVDGVQFDALIPFDTAAAGG